MKNYLKRFLIIFALAFGLMQVRADTQEEEWRGELRGTSEGDKKPPEFWISARS